MINSVGQNRVLIWYEYIHNHKPINLYAYYPMFCIALHSTRLEHCIFYRVVVCVSVYHLFTLYCLCFGLHIECVVCSLEQLSVS